MLQLMVQNPIGHGVQKWPIEMQRLNLFRGEHELEFQKPSIVNQVVY